MSIQINSSPAFKFFCDPDRVSDVCSHVMTFLEGRDVQDLIVGLSYRDKNGKACSPFTRQEMIRGKERLCFKSVRALDDFLKVWGDQPFSRPTAFDLSGLQAIELSGKVLERMLSTSDGEGRPIPRFPKMFSLNLPYGCEDFSCLQYVPQLEDLNITIKDAFNAAVLGLLPKLRSLKMSKRTWVPSEIRIICRKSPNLTALDLDGAILSAQLDPLYELPLKKFSLAWETNGFPDLGRLHLDSFSFCSSMGLDPTHLGVISAQKQLQELTLEDCNALITDATPLESLKQLRELKFPRPLRLATLRTLPVRQLPALTSLHLGEVFSFDHSSIIMDEFLRLFPLPSLKTLAFTAKGDVSNDHMLRLVEGAPNLERLDIRLLACTIACSHLSKLERLRSLTLKRGLKAEVFDLDVLCKMPGLKALSVPHVNQFIKPVLLRVLNHLPGLESLDLSMANLKDNECAFIPRLKHLRVLNLFGNHDITDETVHKICRLPRLRELNLDCCSHLSLYRDNSFRREEIYRQCPHLRIYHVMSPEKAAASRRLARIPLGLLVPAEPEPERPNICKRLRDACSVQ